jgi:hypothetical protein
VVANKETGLEVNAEKTKYMVISPDHHAATKSQCKAGNKSFEKLNSSDLSEQH